VWREQRKGDDDRGLNLPASAGRVAQISTANSVVTLINVFTVDPTNQQRLVELLTCATEDSVRHVPGFVSASLHRSLDGTRVTMYAQWQSVEAYQAMRQAPAPLPFLEEALAIATFEPGMYEVVQTFVPVGEAE
jgi:quinol monooxygenase YgiN